MLRRVRPIAWSWYQRAVASCCKRVGADAGLAGDEPVFGVAVVFGGGLGAVEVGGGADVRYVVAAAVEGVVDGEEMLGGEVVDPVGSGWARRSGLR